MKIVFTLRRLRRDTMRENDEQCVQGRDYLLHFEPAAQSWDSREKILRVRCGVLFTCLSTNVNLAGAIRCHECGLDRATCMHVLPVV